MNEAVNLTNCDREPIHIPGSVQPFGFLLTVLSDFNDLHGLRQCRQLSRD
ncbi:light-regulated signal transduction histidine kinase (bacteriophytochrome) [Bradyrhizobium sp. i1.4.4]